MWSGILRDTTMNDELMYSSIHDKKFKHFNYWMRSLNTVSTTQDLIQVQKFLSQ